MAIYTVHAEDGSGRLSPGAAERIQLVREGVCWPALVVPVLWMPFRRMWLALVLYVAVAVLLSALEKLEVLPPAYAALVAITIAVLLFLEGNDLRRWTLSRRGFRQIGLVDGRSVAEAEIRFFHRAPLAAPPATEAPPPAPPLPPAIELPRPPRPAAESGIIGLFPTPGVTP